MLPICTIFTKNENEGRWIIIITSLQNEQVKLAKSLILHKKRMEKGLFLIEGVRSVFDVLKFQKPFKIFITNELVEVYASTLSIYENELCIVSRQVLQSISDTKTSQGIVAIFAIPHPKQLSSRNILLLDRINDPGNLGTIIRSAAAFNFLDIILYNCVDAFNPKVIRSSMAGFVFVNIIISNNLDISLMELKKQNYTIFCADMKGENYLQYKTNNSPLSDKQKTVAKNCIIIGNEADGINQKIQEKVDKVLSIPMHNVESLNAAVAASILMAHLSNL